MPEMPWGSEIRSTLLIVRWRSLDPAESTAECGGVFQLCVCRVHCVSFRNVPIHLVKVVDFGQYRIRK